MVVGLLLSGAIAGLHWCRPAQPAGATANNLSARSGRRTVQNHYKKVPLEESTLHLPPPNPYKSIGVSTTNPTNPMIYVSVQHTHNLRKWLPLCVNQVLSCNGPEPYAPRQLAPAAKSRATRARGARNGLHGGAAPTATDGRRTSARGLGAPGPTPARSASKASGEGFVAG